MEIGLIFLMGIVIGALIGWLSASSKFGKLKAFESAATELRNRLSETKTALDAKEREISDLHRQLRIEGEQKAAAQAQLVEARAALEGVSIVRDQLSIEGQLRVAAETKLKESQANLEEQKRLLQEATARLTDTFNSLSAEALKSNNRIFLDNAKSTFEAIQAHAKGDLETRQKTIDGLVNPLKEALERYERQIQEMEKARQNAYGSLDEQLRTLATANQQLQKRQAAW